MTGQEKLEFIQKQCDAIWDSGVAKDIECPYCYHTVTSEEGPCCDLMDRAIRAIIQRAKAVEEGLESYRRREFGKMIMGN